MRRVCIVGSGPSGMYTAKYLLKSSLENRLKIDVVDRLPVCYGLVRFGVAPDHPEVKSVSNDFDQVMEDPRVRFFGNVDVGAKGNVSVEELRNAYDAVVLSYGASTDRLLNIPGESGTTNVWGARDFVNWYNGIPDWKFQHVPLLDCDAAAVIGQGNVALDIARILTKSVDELAKTDISRKALDLLSTSRVKDVSVLGRRGAAQAAFTIKELRELTKMEGVGCCINPREYEKSMTEASKEEITTTRAMKRINELMVKIADDYEEQMRKPKRIHIRFLCSPTEISHEESTSRISGVTVQHNQLVGETGKQKAEPIPNDFEKLDCGLLVRSIGYKSEPLPGVPFDERASVVKHSHGKVEPGLYTAGWVKRGPTGIIGTNITDARETVDQIAQDLSRDDAFPVKTDPEDPASVFLPYNSQIVDWKAYKKLDEEELKRGEQLNRTREKFLSVDEMLKFML